MSEDVTTGQSRASLDAYRLSEERLCFQSRADLSYLVAAWRSLDLERYPMMRSQQEWVLSEWDKRTTLHGVHCDSEILRDHPDFMAALISIKFSVDSQNDPNGMLAALVPSTMEVVWSTPAMDHLQLVGDSFFVEHPSVRGAVGLLILIYRLYGDRLDVSKIPIPNGSGMTDVMSYQPEPNGPVRYYRLRFDNEIYTTNSWSVGMGADGNELPELTQEGLDDILTNPYDVEHIASVFDTKKLWLNGIGMVWAEEVTPFVQSATFTDQLARRDALVRRQDLTDLQEQMRVTLRIPDVEVGIVLSPSSADSVRCRWLPHLRSLRFKEEVALQDLAEGDVYLSCVNQSRIFNNLQDEPGTENIRAAQWRSLLVAPLVYHGQFIGLLELASPRSHVFDFYSMPRVYSMVPALAMAINRVHEGEHERMMAVIKQTCTAIHPSVEWRFQEMARDYLTQVERDESPVAQPIVFRQVMPLFGVSDIRGSSVRRNQSIQADLEHQLRLAAKVIEAAGRSHPRPVSRELSSRIRRHQDAIAKGLNSGDETRIYHFLRDVVESAFEELSALSADNAKTVQAYRDELDPDVGAVYQVRRSYDESVTQINDTIGAYLDSQQEAAQRMIPHYFEKFKTDGVDHNIYVGDALQETGGCSQLDIRNLHLWQLMTMCGVVWLMKALKPQLNTPLDTAHLILVQSTPINITFHMEEKHFSVDGAYNARYEIVKKRIDKACIRDNGERLTQPEHIAIVYTQERECQMYKEFITYLQEEGFLEQECIDVLLEDLQGVHGLRALRVRVKEQPPEGWDPKDARTSLLIG
jgi:hypothetical protein